MKRAAIVLILMVSSLTTFKASNAADLHDMAPTCSGHFFILTAIGKKEPALGEYFAERVTVADELTKVYMQDGLGKDITRSQFLKMKAFGTKEAANQLSKDNNFALTNIKACLSWLQEVIEYMQPVQKNFENDPSMAAAALRHPDVPKFDVKRPYRFGNFDQMTPIILSAFAEWKKMGSIIPNETLTDLVGNVPDARNGLSGVKNSFYYYMNSFEQDGLIVFLPSYGPFKSREKCEKEMISKLNKISAKYPNNKWVMSVFDGIDSDSRPEKQTFMSAMMPDGTLKSQYSCIEVKAP